MTTIERLLIAALILLTITAGVFPLYLPQIHAWEKANDYPYGKLCDLYRNCN